METCFRSTRRGHGGGVGVAFDTDDFTGGPNETRGDHGDIAHAGAEIQDTMAGADA